MTRRVVLCLPEGVPRVDPASDETAKRDVELAFDWDGSPAGVAGWADVGLAALDLATEHLMSSTASSYCRHLCPRHATRSSHPR